MACGNHCVFQGLCFPTCWEAAVVVVLLCETLKGCWCWAPCRQALPAPRRFLQVLIIWIYGRQEKSPSNPRKSHSQQPPSHHSTTSGTLCLSINYQMRQCRSTELIGLVGLFIPLDLLGFFYAFFFFLLFFYLLNQGNVLNVVTVLTLHSSWSCQILLLSLHRKSLQKHVAGTLHLMPSRCMAGVQASTQERVNVWD